MICFSITSGIQTVLEFVFGQFPRGSVLILVSGGSCSGKTYFAEQLGKRLQEYGLLVTNIKLDDYFKDIDDPTLPRDKLNRPIYDMPDSYHIREYFLDLMNLLRGEVVEGPVYDLMRNIRVKNKVSIHQPAQVIIAEGLFVFNIPDMKYKPRFAVYIDADVSVRLERRVTRDGKYGVSPQVIERVFYQRIEPYHQAYVEIQKASADIVIVNNERSQ